MKFSCVSTCDPQWNHPFRVSSKALPWTFQRSRYQSDAFSDFFWTFFKIYFMRQNRFLIIREKSGHPRPEIFCSKIGKPPELTPRPVKRRSRDQVTKIFFKKNRKNTWTDTWTCENSERRQNDERQNYLLSRPGNNRRRQIRRTKRTLKTKNTD